VEVAHTLALPVVLALVVKDITVVQEQQVAPQVAVVLMLLGIMALLRQMVALVVQG
jgi:hypothetical protein